MGFVLEAGRLFQKHPRLWQYSIRPLVWSLVLFVGLIALGYGLVVPPVTRFLQGNDWLPSALAGFLATIAYLVAWLLLSGVVFLGIASVLSSFAWDKLSFEVEELAIGVPANERQPTGVVIVDSLSRTAFSLTLGLSAFCCGLFFAGIPGLVAAGLIGLFDFTASAYMRRGIPFGGQWSRVFRLQGWPTFLLTVGGLSLVPFVNVLLLPLLVSAGTLMVARSTDRSGNV